ncbi:pseudouridine synthase [Kiloniella spongiae]|uniref:Pseudouridine synthase n=1 Tax=Kiloniella spongiae TaxID=1489064 RepID=A0A0H2MIS6_9PROT|nr:RluA family pseudouridine synthase [Kiloniella spongiae]KLN62081.1 pseudouridine synthase [Kiloniella spongiae]
MPDSGNKSNDTQIYNLIVIDAEKKQRLDRFLVQHLPDLSRSRLQALIIEKCLTIDKAVIETPNYRLKPGQQVSLTVPSAVDPEPIAQDIPLDIVYEDPYLLIVNKPSGMVVHPAPGNSDGTLVNALLYHCGDDFKGIGGVKRPGIVHRIDKDTSGLMVVAKTDECHQGLVKLFATHDIERSYNAIVWGFPKPSASQIQGNIGRSPKNRKKMAVVPAGGKRAVTHYKTLEIFSDGAASLIECRLETGRTHQIRVHMTHIGHPLLGDPLYGSQSQGRIKNLPAEAQSLMKDFQRQALHAKTLGFSHPITRENLSFSSELSRDLKDLIISL